MIQTRKEEVITTLQDIKKSFTVQNFENQFTSIINHYLSNWENLSYRDMRSQLDLNFKVDMNPLIIYIINALSISDRNVDSYIKSVDKIKRQYGDILHTRHQAAMYDWSMA